MICTRVLLHRLLTLLGVLTIEACAETGRFPACAASVLFDDITLAAITSVSSSLFTHFPNRPLSLQSHVCLLPVPLLAFVPREMWWLTPSHSQTQHHHKAYSTFSVWSSGWPVHRRDFPAPSSTRGHRMVGHPVDSPVDLALFNIDR